MAMARQMAAVKGATPKLSQHPPNKKDKPKQRFDTPVNAIKAAKDASGDPSSMASIMAQQLEDEQDKEEEGHWFTDNLVFKLTIGLAVLANTIQMGMEADRPEWNRVWLITEHIFTGLFFGEMVIKLCFLRCTYFADHWNWLDAALVSLSVLDTWMLPLVDGAVTFDMQNLSILRVFRLFRLVRVLKLVKGVRRFVLVIKGVMDAIQATFWVSGVMMLAIYIAAIFCVGILGKDSTTYPGYSEDEEMIDTTDLMMDFNPHLFFGSIGSSMLTLFNVVILAEWSEIVRPIMIKQPFLVVFFVGFITFTTFGVMNVIIGMIVENVMSNARAFESDEVAAELQRKLQTLEEIHTMWGSLDQDDDGRVTAETLALCMQDKHSTMRQLLSQVDLPRGFQPTELMYMLDHNGDGGLNQDELTEGMYRLIDSGPFQSICLVQKGINEVKLLLRQNLVETQAAVAESRAVTLAAVEECRKCMEFRNRSLSAPVAPLPASLSGRPSTFPASGLQWLASSDCAPGQQLRSAIGATEDLANRVRRDCAAEAPGTVIPEEVIAHAGPPSYEEEAKFGGESPPHSQRCNTQAQIHARDPGLNSLYNAAELRAVEKGAKASPRNSDRCS